MNAPVNSRRLTAMLALLLSVAASLAAVADPVEGGRLDAVETVASAPSREPIGAFIDLFAAGVRSPVGAYPTALAELESAPPRCGASSRDGALLTRHGFGCQPAAPSAPICQRFLAALRDGTLSSRSTGLPPPG